jgi:heat shock protein HtpX
MDKSLFERVRRNKQRTWLVFFLFYLIFLALGSILGLVWGDITFGIIIAFIVAVFYFLIMYWSAESAILAAMDAKPVTPQSHPVLYNVVDGMRIAAGIPMPKVYVIDDTALNAFATGRDPERGVIVVTSGLLAKLDRRELEGVIAHEMSHIKNYDIRVMLYSAVMVGAILLLSDILLRSFLWGGKGGSGKGGQARIVLILIGLALAILAPFIAQLIQLAVSRRREYLADADAVVLTRYPKGLAGALRKIKSDPDPLVDHANKATAHMFINVPFRQHGRFWQSLFSTHPPIDERIAIIERM